MTYESREIWNLPHRHIGRRVHRFDRLGSTNTHALELAGQPDSDGLAVLADEQLAGRGQHGRTWQAPPCSSVLLSVLLYPPKHLNRPALLTAWAAVSVCEVVESMTGVRPRIKWPNDVLLAGRKICGILIEQSRQGDCYATVVGIGLNVNQQKTDFAAACLPEATSLALASGVPRETHDVARLLLAVLDDGYSQLLDGNLPGLEGAWNDYLELIGRQVIVECSNNAHTGRLIECALDGLMLEQAGGEILHLLPEVVLHIQSR